MRRVLGRFEQTDDFLSVDNFFSAVGFIENMPFLFILNLDLVLENILSIKVLNCDSKLRSRFRKSHHMYLFVIFHNIRYQNLKPCLTSDIYVGVIFIKSCILVELSQW